METEFFFQSIQFSFLWNLLQQCMWFAYQIVSLDRSDKVARNELSALMDELIERVLSIGTRLAPHNRTGAIVDLSISTRHELSVGLHVALLEIGGESMQVLIVREDSLGLGAVEVVVPEADESHQNRYVLLERRRSEVLVGQEGALQQPLEVLETDVERDRETDSRPQWVAAAYPIPEAEHVLFVDAECYYFFFVCRQRYEMFRHVLLLLGRLNEP